jgi:hypothetical protein
MLRNDVESSRMASALVIPEWDGITNLNVHSNDVTCHFLLYYYNTYVVFCCYSFGGKPRWRFLFQLILNYAVNGYVEKWSALVLENYFQNR